MARGSIVFDVLGWLFGVVAIVIGLINTFWGNDAGYGIFILLLAFAFFPPVNTFLVEKTGYRIHPVLKILLAIFIVWSAMGVGELPDKIDLMMKDLRASFPESADLDGAEML